MDFFVGFECDDGQAGRASDSESFQRGAGGRRERRHLRIHRFRPQPPIERRDVAQVSAPSTVDCVSWSFTPTMASAPRPWRGGRTLIAIAAKIEAPRPILPHALHLQPERVALFFSRQHPPPTIPPAVPTIPQATDVLPSNRIF